MIPKIIHQTWKTHEVPPEWRLAVASWQRFHPHWTHRIWSNEDGYEFVEQHYPALYPKYCDYPYDIQRADVIRYLLVHHFGGLYVDMDYECLRAFDALTEDKQFLAGYEPPGHFVEKQGKNIICNALFAAQAGDEFLGALIEALANDQSQAVSMEDVLKTTGPLMMQQVLDRYEGISPDIFQSQVFCPLSASSSALQQLAGNGSKAAMIRRLLIDHGAYAVHYWSNSWAANISSTPLYNPHPGEIPGFTFHPGVDSVGHDRFNAGRDIPGLAARCAQDARIIAFNTDGFAKHRLRPRDQWSRVGNPDGNKGLYVRNGVDVDVNDPRGNTGNRVDK